MNEPFNEKNDSFASLQSRREKSAFPNYLKQGQTFEDQVVEDGRIIWWRGGVSRLLESGLVEFATLVWLGTDLDDAVRRLSTFGFAVQLIAEPLDVVHAIGDDDGVTI